MGRIEIKDLPKDVKISKEEMKRMRGGGLVSVGLCVSPVMYGNCAQACRACQSFTSQCQDGQACANCQPLSGLIGENG
jgi:hypothetical protein